MSVLSVSMSDSHSFCKAPTPYIYLLPGLGVQGDIHCGTKPTSSNKRQVHLIDSSLFVTLAKPSTKHPTFELSPGSLGENITTENVDLFSLSEGTKLHFGDHEGHAVVKITGVREPTRRLGEWPDGLLNRCKVKDGKERKTRVGVMGAVINEGYVEPGYGVRVEKPKSFKPLGVV